MPLLSELFSGAYEEHHENVQSVNSVSNTDT